MGLSYEELRKDSGSMTDVVIHRSLNGDVVHHCRVSSERSDSHEYNMEAKATITPNIAYKLEHSSEQIGSIVGTNQPSSSTNAGIPRQCDLNNQLKLSLI